MTTPRKVVLYIATSLDGVIAQQKLHLLGSRSFDTGLVQLHYAVART